MKKPSLLYIAMALLAAFALLSGAAALVLAEIEERHERRVLAQELEANNEANYSFALNELAGGEHHFAAYHFAQLGDHKDAARLADLCAAAYLRGLDLSSTASPYGPLIPFGRLDGGDIAEWVVLDIQDGKALLLHKGNRGAERYLEEFSFSSYEEVRIADREPEIPLGLLENIPYYAALRPAIWMDIT